MAMAMGVIAHAMQVALFGIEPEVRLSVARRSRRPAAGASRSAG